MLILESRNIKKSFGNKLILDIKTLNIDSKDRIGIVGNNGIGKTTLINILSKQLTPDEGFVKIHGKYSYIHQYTDNSLSSPNSYMLNLFKLPKHYSNFMSGGEKTKFKIAASFSKNSSIIFADEPTSNLDIKSINLLEKELLTYHGALVIISHDRAFLNKLCNKILEIEQHKIKIYIGNYDSYKQQKKDEIERQNFEYKEYIKEKNRLENSIIDRTQHRKKMRKNPKHMGPSEARANGLGNQEAERTVDKSIKALKSRLKKLEVKNRPATIYKSNFDITSFEELHGKILIKGTNINKKFSNKIIFNSANFEIYNGWKIALIGENGCGKTTLIQMIMNNEPNIYVTKALRPAYFDQELNILDENKTIIENVASESIYNNNFIRLFLSRLLFKGDDCFKKVKLLSGGEKVKVSFAKIFLKNMNMLILDEPTNYLDIYSREAIESTLNTFNGTILFVSHDRAFIENLADHLMIIENNKIKVFNGTYKEYLENKNSTINSIKLKDQKLIIENRISEILSKISLSNKKDELEALEVEYNSLSNNLKQINKCKPM